VTTPLEELPANALDDARKLLHGVLVLAFERVGWTTARAELYPLATPKVPGAWVDVPTLSAQGQGLVATFLLGIAVDGAEQAQVRRLDALMAVLWELLEAVKIPQGSPRLAAGSTLQVMTVGPELLDIGGPTTRSLALTVQVPIGPRTLCPTALTEEN